MKFHKVLAVLTLLFLLFGCESENTTKQVHFKEVTLLAEMSSGATFESIKDKFQNCSFVVKEEVKFNRSDSSSIVAHCKTFSFNNYSGELTVSFFNDKLYQTRFHPNDNEFFSKYPLLQEFENTSRLQEDKQGVLIWVADDHEGRRFLSLLDKTIYEQQKKWIRDNS